MIQTYNIPIKVMNQPYVELYWKILWMVDIDDIDFINKMLFLGFQYYTRNYINALNDR